MNIDKMSAAQAELDKEISLKKGLKPTGNMAWKVKALDVELSEMANEHRGFKMWSDDRKPRTDVVRYEKHDEPPVRRNLLLEEFADGTSFFLSIANENGWQDALYIHEEAMMDMETEGLQGGVIGAYLEMKYFLLKAAIEKHDKNAEIFGVQKNKYFFSLAWMLFIGIGLIGYGFTEDQIEEAYYAKNKINHERQESGY